MAAQNAFLYRAQEERPTIESFVAGAKKAGAPEPTPSYTPGGAPSKEGRNWLHIVYAVVAVVVVLGVAYYALTQLHVISIGNMTTPATTIQTLGFDSCMNITKPGVYMLSGDINTKIAAGACIDVLSSNVKIVGNGHTIMGNGPFVGTPPFTYGIMAGAVKNVTVTGLIISTFSYGIELSGTQGSLIANTSVNKTVLSGVLLLNSYDNELNDVSVTGVPSRQGGITLSGGGHNEVLNSESQGNDYYGIVINSTNNTFSNDAFTNNPSDLFCGGAAGFKSSNKFYSSMCTVNDYCSFAVCSVVNLPANLSSIVLSNNIDECGGIYTSGTYRLASNLNALDYINATQSGQPCIKIAAPNVNLDCQGHSISNAEYGILAPSTYNLSVSNCLLVNNTYGFYVNSSFNYDVNNVTISHSTYGFFSSQSERSVASNMILTNNTFGAYVSGVSTGVLFSDIRSLDNTYGVYLESGGGNAFSGGKLENNTRADLYCTQQTYNSTSDLFQSTQCGVTDCDWASSCTSHILPPLSLHPITSCTAITESGNYSVNTNIPGNGDCINVTASNVNIYCNGHIFIGKLLGGSAFAVSGASNVTITGCRSTKFGNEFNVSDSSFITLSNSTAINDTSAIVFSGVRQSKVSDISTTGATGYAAFIFNGVSNTDIEGLGATDGLAHTSGIALLNSNDNLLALNNVTSNTGNGIMILDSLNNNIENNTALTNGGLDYECDNATKGIYAESGNGINYGLTKNTCEWLVLLNPSNKLPYCYPVTSSQYISLQSDIWYPYGSICFNVYDTNRTQSNNTVVNCNGHTILATDGGTFVWAKNASDVTVENCYIKGFTQPLLGSAPGFSVLNNTIVDANTSILVLHGSEDNIENNLITNSTTGIVLQDSPYGTLRHNTITNTPTGIQVIQGFGRSILDNLVSGSQIAAYLINSTNDVFGNNTFVGSRYGIYCTQGAASASSLNNDGGNETCSSNDGCVWVTSRSCQP